MLKLVDYHISFWAYFVSGQGQWSLIYLVVPLQRRSCLSPPGPDVFSECSGSMPWCFLQTVSCPLGGCGYDRRDADVWLADGWLCEHSVLEHRCSLSPRWWRWWSFVARLCEVEGLRWWLWLWGRSCSLFSPRWTELLWCPLFWCWGRLFRCE